MKSAIAGCAEGQCNLGCCYGNGIGTDKNIEKSFIWYLKSAEGGNATAQHYIGDCYYYGIGINKNNDEAINWYRKASYNGVEEAKNKLNNILSVVKVNNSQDEIIIFGEPNQ
ncbi:HCP-like protein [Rhizophagus irregularis]|uniref:HCP-like protein n=1 Tax=Rhizophagus irregularis TaxID=588596 RepID=A0A2N0RJY1_9GLOM|nr:HCP-like protein [Rhizophagus irregularis]